MVFLTYWHWLIVGCVLLGLETFVPGAPFLWLGLAALMTGLVSVLLPLSWELQVVCFTICAFVALIAWKKYFRALEKSSDRPNLNKKMAPYVGQIFPLDKAIENGRGRIRIGDTLWTVIHEHPLPAGTPVRLTAIKGAVFQIEVVSSC
jgi:membrane protein implicated in regulation of membrane protease activity